ncbi:MAG TPA: glycosyltransferase [Steroidobacteraceae bacterium]|nr:glycosyltransferase [Steroidobacteraceae bacterium]
MTALTVLSVAFPLAPVSRDPVGGAEQILAALDGALVERGHRSIVIARAGSRTAGSLVEIAAEPGPFDPACRARAQARVRAAIAEVCAREPVDVVHLHGLDFAAYLPAAGLPVLATLHLPAASYPTEALNPARPNTWLVPVSAAQARAIASAALLPAIDNGVEVPPARPHARRGYVLALGRICPEKAYDEALDAAALAGRPMLLAGHVFAYPEHEQYFRERIAPRLDARRRWIGPVSGARKRRLLEGARCLLIPSRIEETSSLVAMEALAAGTPPIGYRIGALPEVIEHGVSGFIVDDAAGMARAIEAAMQIDPERCRRAARERFGLERMIEAYLGLYRRLAQ